MKKTYSNLMLLLTALIWGCAFTAQSAGMDYIGPWTFTCIRSYIGAAVLSILMPVLDRIRGIDDNPIQDRKMFMKAGIACGTALAAASMFQQTGIIYTTAGKAGFLSALYVLFVPVLASFQGRKIEKKIWFCAVLAVTGFYYLSMYESFTLGKGDILVLICALLFAVHILVIDHFASKTDGVRMSALQFLVCALICTGPMLVFEKPDLKSVIDAAVPILYAGVISSGAGYTLQILGQKEADPSVACLILSLESVFAAMFGFLLLKETMTLRELFGSALIFSAIIISQINGKSEVEK